MINENQGAGKGADFLRGVGQAARDNPIPAALIGIGLVWMFSGGKPVSQAARMARSVGIDPLPDMAANSFARGRAAVTSGVDAALDGAAEVGSRVRDAVGSVGGQIGDAASAAGGNMRARRDNVVQRASQAASTVTDQARGASRFVPAIDGEFFAAARANVADAFQRQPLLLGAIGIAIGAGIAASAPSTHKESEWLGETSDRLKRNARDFAQSQTWRAAKVASGVASAVVHEAQAQGLTPDDAKAAVGDLGEKLRSVADAATDSARERLN